VCWCSGYNAACTDLFLDVTNLTEYKFHSGLRNLQVRGVTNLEMEEDIFVRWNITSLTGLDLMWNKIRKIWQRAFYGLADLERLNLYNNSITRVDKMLFNNTRLKWLCLAGNGITELDRSTFQNNVILDHLLIYENELTSLHPDLFKNNLELKWVDLHENRIVDIHPSTFRNNNKLSYLDLARNEINTIHVDLFKCNVELTQVELQENRIVEHPSTVGFGFSKERNK
jgi:Leucine-rich repeat (LRR) protein